MLVQSLNPQGYAPTEIDKLILYYFNIVDKNNLQLLCKSFDGFIWENTKSITFTIPKKLPQNFLNCLSDDLTDPRTLLEDGLFEFDSTVKSYAQALCSIMNQFKGTTLIVKDKSKWDKVYKLLYSFLSNINLDLKNLIVKYEINLLVLKDKLSSLESLSFLLPCQRFTPIKENILASFSLLKELSIGNDNAHISNLFPAVLDSCTLTALYVEKLTVETLNFTNLETLSMRRCVLSSTFSFGNLVHIKCLSLSGTTIYDSNIETLTTLSNLCSLDLSYNNSRIDFSLLQQLTTLKELNVIQCPIDEKEFINSLTTLTSLSINGDFITNLTLCNLDYLEIFDLDFTPQEFGTKYMPYINNLKPKKVVLNNGEHQISFG